MLTGEASENWLVEWLFANAGPVLRYRIACEWMGLSAQERNALQQASLETPEVKRWLAHLNLAVNIHGSKDSDAENALAKLLDYGFDRGLPAFDAGVRRLLELPLKQWDALVLLPFLLRGGYADHPRMGNWLTERVEKLYRIARDGSYDFYLSPQETAGLPKAWRGKVVYRDEFGHQSGYALPTSYDFYALAYCPPVEPIQDLAEKLETIVAFLSDPRFQATPGGYGWDRDNRRCYAAGRVFLACAAPARLLLFLELGAGFAAARRSEWFQNGLAHLERYRTPRGTYLFPPGWLAEREGNHIYGGAHLGMGENRRSAGARERESTFRWLAIHKRLRIAT